MPGNFTLTETWHRIPSVTSGQKTLPLSNPPTTNPFPTRVGITRQSTSLIPQLDGTLAVYIGAHPDDIDVGMSGSLYKYDLNRHPILWIVVTDGGADATEYLFDSGFWRMWIKRDGQKGTKEWITPDGKKFYRNFYSEDLARKRSGIDGSYHHLDFQLFPPALISEYDWQTRVSIMIGKSGITKVQMIYPNPFNPSQSLYYPDGSLNNYEDIYTETLAQSLADIIFQTVTSARYRKDKIFINSHVPEEIGTHDSALEHLDHKITGNAVRNAIDILYKKYNFTNIKANWYAIYSPVTTNPGYISISEDISYYKNKKSDLCKVAWETAFIKHHHEKFYWNSYPDDPGDFEFVVKETYYSSGP